MKTFIIASTSSNSGKTLVTSLLISLLKEKYKVVAFKAGPDFIDPKFQESILNEPSYNLDLNIIGPDIVKSLFYNHCKDKNIAIIEGVMGLFDGKSDCEINANGSTFELAKIINVPIILLVDCFRKGQSVIAEMVGYTNLAEIEGKKISGILLNRTSRKNYEYLEKEFKKYSNIPIIGFIPNLDFSFDSRHLGLFQPFEYKDINEKIKTSSKELLKTINIDKLLEICETNLLKFENCLSMDSFKGMKVGVAYDEAFNFYYQDNLELLEKLGCSIIKFSPLHDKFLPKDLNLLYLGGGYPELYLEELEKNKSFRDDLKDQIENGLTCLAECGGMIYLTKTIILKEKKYSGIGIFDCDIEFKNHLVRFGYNDLYFQDFNLKTHEFHYSDYICKNNPNFLFKIKKGNNLWSDGMRYKNTFGFYPHIHFYSQPDGFKFLNFILNIANGSSS